MKSVELEVIVSCIKGLDNGIKKLDKELGDHENITSINGVGIKNIECQERITKK